LVGGDLWITTEPVWPLLLGQPPLFQMSRTQLAFGRGGFLTYALSRFPGNARLLLARTEGRESIETRCPEQFCHDEITPATLERLRSRAKSGSSGRIHDMAVANLSLFERLVPVAAEFAELAGAHPEVRAEANVHIGYLAIRAGRPDAALAPLETARKSDDPHVLYLAEFFSGRALEALGRRPEAIAAYRRALTAVPDAPSATMLLASQLFLSGDAAERADAHKLLEAANRSSSQVVDPWDQYWYGDRRFRATYMERLRQALQP
jgi:tetratricopeptide (TPR) repeat protein